MYLRIYILITATPVSVYTCWTQETKPDSRTLKPESEPIEIGLSTLKPERQPIEIGKDVIFNCSHNSDSKFPSQNEWKQFFPIDNLTIKYKPNVNSKEYNLRLKLQKFDNDTILTCRQNHSIIFLPTNLTSDLYINEKKYNEETVDCDCSKFARPNYLIQVDANKHIRVLSENTKKIFSRADNIDLYCMYFKAENEHEVTRYVKKINSFIYQDESELVSSLGNNFKVYFYVGGAIIVLMILIIIFILWNRRQCCNKSKQPAESEDVNPNAGQVTYAELELRPVPNNTPIVEETPYAEIIPYKSYLDRDDKRPEYMESPYANC